MQPISSTPVPGLFDGMYDRWMKKMENPYMPMFLVFLSGIGFSIQSLAVKLLEERTGFNASFQIVFWRGFVQCLISYYFIVQWRTEADPNKEIFGATPYVTKVLITRAFVGFCGIAFAFLGVEKLPIADNTVLVMLSPVWSTIFSFLVLGEPWRFPEFVAMVSQAQCVWCARYK